MRKSSVYAAALGVATALGVVAALLLCMATVRPTPAWAYFTDSHETEGGIRIAVKPTSDIEEEFDGNVKHVYIRNMSEDVPLWVRARAYVANGQLSYIGNDPDAGGSWFDGGDGWWYWGKALMPGEHSEELRVEMALKLSESTTINYPDGTSETFVVTDHTDENTNVVVVYEAVPVQGDNPQDADWRLAS